ncbi:hypothetical protein GGR52DRAFT_401095 [Hypoxylon sp. FL1284]|nr:hypothetical protein GGR52DRAFT_401095 [Hypoxylon sp. FL1284]
MALRGNIILTASSSSFAGSRTFFYGLYYSPSGYISRAVAIWWSSPQSDAAAGPVSSRGRSQSWLELSKVVCEQHVVDNTCARSMQIGHSAYFPRCPSTRLKRLKGTEARQRLFPTSAYGHGHTRRLVPADSRWRSDPGQPSLPPRCFWAC